MGLKVQRYSSATVVQAFLTLLSEFIVLQHVFIMHLAHAEATVVACRI